MSKKYIVYEVEDKKKKSGGGGSLLVLIFFIPGLLNRLADTIQNILIFELQKTVFKKIISYFLQVIGYIFICIYLLIKFFVIIFGGKKLFLERQKNLISKEDYKIKKLRPLNVVGAAYNKGNCKFQIVSENEILFKPNAKEHFSLKLENVGKTIKRNLSS